MQIFNTPQIHAWDEFTIEHEPIASIDLMERAASACYDWLMANGYQHRSFSIFCGKGNNGGDGLAIARMLASSGHNVSVHILEFGHKGTNDFQQNLSLLHESTASITFIPNEAIIPEIPSQNVVIDAIFGSGLNRALEGLTASVVDCINNSSNPIISIDIPTGLFADKSSEGKSIVKASHTLTFQTYKLSFLYSDSQEYIGILHILNIGLHAGYLNKADSMFHITDENLVRSIIRKRKKFSHKGDYGNGGLITGSKGLMGAAVLAARSFMRSGAGKLTCHIPSCGFTIMQTAVPEAMCKVGKGEDHIVEVTDLDKYDAIGIGPGIGLYDSHSKLLEKVFNQFKKASVVDADALNILARNKNLLNLLPAGSILTPHTREFERLFGTLNNDDERILQAMSAAALHNIVIVLKGPFTLIATPGGRGYFNNTGNPGMATAGSGDVLTGIITGLLCQGYTSEQAAILGVYVHGMAGDVAANSKSMEALIASDISDHLGNAFMLLK